MKQDSTNFLRFVKYAGITVGALTVSGIAALMVISRGKGEDITGIVAPASLLVLVSAIVAIVALTFLGSQIASILTVIGQSV